MNRTLVNLDPDDKAWLDQQAKVRRVPMAELVRQAVRGYRLREESQGRDGLHSSLRDTAGIWRHGDGLAWQHALRDEWDER
jgi:hypothetical protein